MATKKKGKPAKPQAKKTAKPPTKAAKPARKSPPKAKSKPPARKAPGKPPATEKRSLVQAAMAGASRILSSLQPSNVLSRSTQTPSSVSQTEGSVRYLTVQDLVEPHRAVSTEFGGTQAQPGVVES